MTSFTMTGTWRIRVVSKSSDWAQRIVIRGATPEIIPGRVGESAVVRGARWQLAIEHNAGGGWRENAFLHAEPPRSHSGRVTQLVVTKDHYWAGDRLPDDLVIELEEGSRTPSFEVLGMPAGMTSDLRLAGYGELGRPGVRYLAVAIRNDGFRSYGYDTALEVSDAGQRALAGQGIEVRPFTAADLRATRQETFGRAVALPPLEPGDQATAYFPVDNSLARPGQTEVEFMLSRTDAPGEALCRRAALVPVTLEQPPGVPVQRGVPVQAGAAVQPSQPGERAQRGVPAQRMVAAQPALPLRPGQRPAGAGVRPMAPDQHRAQSQ
jgi:hypothetical protein